MKTVLAALNAAYVHTNLAVRAIKAFAQQRNCENITVWERTINHREDVLLRELASLEAGMIIFSIYLWNVELAVRLAENLHQLDPNLILVAAGPEVSYDCEAFLAANPAFRFVIPGEGEAATVCLLQNPTAQPVPQPALDMDELPFPYGDLKDLKGRILYYESMRGCPFRCAYCLSSIDRGPVRTRSLPLVFGDLRQFLDAGVKQVKFVDRTFNCDRARALAVWKWLREHDNGVTGFHFEIAGELLDEAALTFLEGARPGLFQFEIGVQSTSPQTLSAIHRSTALDKLFANVSRLRQADSIHLHLDLIAGLPLEDYNSFARSFDTVYGCRPHQLQLGFLKILKGSAMETMAQQYGIRYRRRPPYEVLATNSLTYRELCKLHGAAEMVEKYYNSGRFASLIEDLVRCFAGPFAFYEALGDFFTEGGYDLSPPSKTGYYQILGDFMAYMGILQTERRQWLCKYDMALHEKPKKLPSWVGVDGSGPNRQPILRFLRGQPLSTLLPAFAGEDPKYIFKVCHLEVFPFHPAGGQPDDTLVLFDYTRRDAHGHAVTHSFPWSSVENSGEI